MKIFFSSALVCLMIFSKNSFGSERRGVQMGSSVSPRIVYFQNFALQSKIGLDDNDKLLEFIDATLVNYLDNTVRLHSRDLNEWCTTTTQAMINHLKAFPKSIIPLGQEKSLACVAAAITISEDEKFGIRPLLSEQVGDNPRQAQERYKGFLIVLNFRTWQFYNAYLAEQAKRR